ncbi:hypothetical protein [Streptomyces sp. H27-H5]|uniref:hypothetical protein n=1 Tax=Streptomyces sp. H27-H5 TaxID=2996460 RepID=UPI00226F1147|nr:hypothetical protein [Streptomyces sp. H27-H5]MCY0962008.1 hypothetical protein [Streptomyces sp. H27-H5]
MTKPQRNRAQDKDLDDRGWSAQAFAALLLAAFAVVAVCALIGGWPGLVGIAVTAIVLIGIAAYRL